MNMPRLPRILLVGLLLLAAALAPVAAATIKVAVNSQPITDFQIAQRLALFKLEGKKGQQAAIDELVNESLMLQEGARLGFNVSEGEVDDSILTLARRLKMSASNLEKILTAQGVGMQTLRDRLKANVAWGKVVGTVVSSKVTVSDADAEAEAETKLTTANSFDYILTRVLFVSLPEYSASKRTAQAKDFRSKFTDCKSAAVLSESYPDVAVVPVGRRHATQFPQAIADELSKLNANQLTSPRVTDAGVEMLAVCAKAVSDDTTFLVLDLKRNSGTAKLQKEAEKYLADLKAKAEIIYS
jgi:peptidyl-prolyl cis-trans isomerase SurA